MKWLTDLRAAIKKAVIPSCPRGHPWSNWFVTNGINSPYEMNTSRPYQRYCYQCWCDRRILVKEKP